MDIGFQTCVICNNKVETKNVVSTLESDATNLDSRPKGIARCAEKNFVNLCDNCGYSSFNLSLDITEGHHEILESKEYLDIFHDPDLVKDAKKFYLTGLILLDREQYNKAAYSFLRASWFFNDNGNKEWMIKSKKQAINAFLNDEHTFKNEQQCSIMIDCYRRIGDFDGAIKAIKEFGIENVQNEYYQKLFKFEEMLALEKDSSIHSSTEVYEKVQ